MITISTHDPEIVITGRTDGSVIMSNVRTGEACVPNNAHTHPVSALDAMDDCVVSAGYDNMIHVYQCVGRCLVHMVSQRVPSTPTSIKLVMVRNRRCVMVVRKCSASVEYYTTEEPTLIRRFEFHNNRIGPHSFTHLEIKLNKTRTQYVIAANDTPNLHIIFGEVGQPFNATSTVEGAPQNEYSVPKLAWTNGSPYVWIAGVDKFVRQVRILDGVVVRKLDPKAGFVRDVQVSNGDKKIVTAIGDLGMQRWQLP